MPSSSMTSAEMENTSSCLFVSCLFSSLVWYCAYGFFIVTAQKMARKAERGFLQAGRGRAKDGGFKFTAVTIQGIDRAALQLTGAPSLPSFGPTPTRFYNRTVIFRLSMDSAFSLCRLSGTVGTARSSDDCTLHPHPSVIVSLPQSLLSTAISEAQ